MSQDYNTPGVPTPEESARKMRDMTRALPSIQTVGGPAIYEQVIPEPLDNDPEAVNYPRD